MRLRNTFVLLGVTVALVLFIVVFERSTPSTDELLEAERSAFPGFKKNRGRADAIEIVRGEAKTVLVRRDIGTKDERWYMTQPIEYPADRSRIISLLGAFERAERFRVEENKRSIPVVPTTNLVQYGLDQDSATRVRVASGDETLLDAFVGCKAAGAERVYVMPAEREEVYVVGEDVRDNATSRLDEFRDKRLLDLRAGEVTQFTILENEKPLAEFAREKGGLWRMVSPVADRADDVAVGEIADKLGSLWADDFKQDFAADDPEMPKKLAGWGLRPALRSVKLTLDVDGSMRRHEVLFGEKIKKISGSERSWDVYAMVAGTRTVVRMPDDIAEMIDVKVDDLRDHKVFAFERSGVQSLSVDRPAGPLAFEKTGEDEWRLTEPEEHKADRRRVEDLVGELAELRAQKFLPFETELAEPIRVEVVLAKEERDVGGGGGGGEGGKRRKSGRKRRSEVVFFEGEKRGSVKARRGAAGAVFEIAPAVLDRLGASKFRYWDRTVLEFEPDHIRRITITCGDRTETAVRLSAAAQAGERAEDEEGRKAEERKERLSAVAQAGKEHRGWKLAGEGEVDVGAADKIKWDFSDLEAEELLGPREQGQLRAYGLDAPAVRVVLELRGVAVKSGADRDDRTYVLRVGALAEAAARPYGGQGGIKTYYAKFEDDPMVFLLRESLVKRIRKGLTKAGEPDEGGGEEEKRPRSGDEADAAR